MKICFTKYHILLLTLSILASIGFISCDDDNNPNNRNEFLRASNPSFSLNLTLVSNADLTFNGGERFVSRSEARGSILGVYIRRISANNYVAFELSEPNNPPGTCDTPTLEDGLFLVYQCGEKTSKYNTIDGNRIEGEGQFTLKAFPVSRNGDFLFIN